MGLLCANKSWDGILFREEIERMPEAMPLRGVHVLEDPDQYPYFICGPAPIMHVAEAALKNAGLAWFERRR
jgi:ferredoxin-NADP reductase